MNDYEPRTIPKPKVKLDDFGANVHRQIAALNSDKATQVLVTGNARSGKTSILALLAEAVMRKRQGPILYLSPDHAADFMIHLGRQGKVLEQAIQRYNYILLDDLRCRMTPVVNQAVGRIITAATDYDLLFWVVAADEDLKALVSSIGNGADKLLHFARLSL